MREYSDEHLPMKSAPPASSIETRYVVDPSQSPADGQA
jgi:hypothetical protein